jgi:hypothetical protein
MQLLQGVPPPGLAYIWNPAPGLRTPELVSPADGAAFLIPGTLSWNPVAGATSYEFVLLAPNGGSYRPTTVQAASVNFTRTDENAGYSSALLNMPGQ